MTNQFPLDYAGQFQVELNKSLESLDKKLNDLIVLESIKEHLVKVSEGTKPVTKELFQLTNIAVESLSFEAYEQKRVDVSLEEISNNSISVSKLKLGIESLSDRIKHLASIIVKFVISDHVLYTSHVLPKISADSNKVAICVGRYIKYCVAEYKNKAV